MIFLKRNNYLYEFLRKIEQKDNTELIHPEEDKSCHLEIGKKKRRQRIIGGMGRISFENVQNKCSGSSGC